MYTKKEKQNLDKMISFRITKKEYLLFTKLSKEQKIIKSIQLRNFVKTLLQSN